MEKLNSEKGKYQIEWTNRFDVLQHTSEMDLDKLKPSETKKI